MDRKQQPTIFKNHNVEEVIERSSGQQHEVSWQLRQAIQSPDDRQEINTAKAHPLRALDAAAQDLYGKDADLDFLVPMVSTPLMHDRLRAKAQLFQPHERQDVFHDGVMAVVETSVVAVGVYRGRDRRAREERTLAGTMFLFKLAAHVLGEEAPEPTADDLVWGSNCRYGAALMGDDVTYFEVQLQDASVSDAHEERISLVAVQPGSDEYQELELEMDKFLISRRAQGAIH